MNKKEKQARRIGKLLNTSVDDCRISLQSENDPQLLCDLLIECSNRGEGNTSREQVVRRRIAKLIKAGVIKSE